MSRKKAAAAVIGSRLLQSRPTLRKRNGNGRGTHPALNELAEIHFTGQRKGPDVLGELNRKRGGAIIDRHSPETH